ncbi:MAG: phosphatase PAP2 family protein [Eubacteriales bacterium]|nr:phosphatase PAP2 family protein [Eubacteriales bacterium]
MQFLYFLAGFRNAILNPIMQAFTLLSEESLLLLVILVVYWCVHKKLGLQLLFITLWGTCINSILKLIFQVPRPWIKDPNFTIVESARSAATGFSFPSGHTQGAGGLYGSLALFSKGLWRALFWIVLALIAFSRMYLGVHTPQDVVVSLILSIVMAFFVQWLFKQDHHILKAFIALVAFTLLSTLLLPYIPKKASYDATVAQSILHDSYLLLGSSLGACVGLWLEQRKVQFSTKAPLILQGIKCILGIALVMGIRIALKPLLLAAFNNNIATLLRYFCIALFGVAIWPMSFVHLEKLYNSMAKQ